MRGAGGCDFAARPSRSGLDQPIHWTPAADPAAIVLASPPDWLTTTGSPSALDLKNETAAPEADYARWDDEHADVPLILLPGTTSGTPLAALVIFGDDELDRAEALIRFCLRRLGRTAPDRRLTPFRRRRIPMELRAADARFEGASYREIAQAIHGQGRVADEDDWRSSPLRNEAIDLVAGGRALIAGGYHKLFHHRRRP